MLMYFIMLLSTSVLSQVMIVIDQLIIYFFILMVDIVLCSIISYSKFITLPALLTCLLCFSFLHLGPDFSPVWSNCKVGFLIYSKICKTSCLYILCMVCLNLFKDLCFISNQCILQICPSISF